MLRNRWWVWNLAVCLCLPVFSGCGAQRGDQKQSNRGLDRPKYVPQEEIQKADKENPKSK
jgi:hypothetical protein